MDNVYCDGSEDELAKCRFDSWGVSDCGSNEAAGVVCSHDEEARMNLVLTKKKPPKSRIKDAHSRGTALRLSGGRVRSEGRIEIKLGDAGKVDKWISPIKNEVTNMNLIIVFNTR